GAAGRSDYRISERRHPALLFPDNLGAPEKDRAVLRVRRPLRCSSWQKSVPAKIAIRPEVDLLPDLFSPRRLAGRILWLGDRGEFRLCGLREISKDPAVHEDEGPRGVPGFEDL